MQTRNGVYAARKTDSGIRAVFIDEEAIELSNLNRRTSENRASSERAEMADQARKIQLQKNNQEEQRRRKRTEARIIKQELKLLGAGAVVLLGECLGMVDTAFAVPVLLGFQAVICYRAGKFIGRQRRS